MNSNMETQSHRLPITEIELCAWLGEAGTGDSLIYHRGSLANDRSPTASGLPPHKQMELARVARRVLAMAEAGLVEVVQRRHGPDDYEYWIRVRPRRLHVGSVLQRVLAAELG